MDTIWAIRELCRGEKGGFIGFSDSCRRTSDDGPSWTATDDLNFELVD